MDVSGQLLVSHLQVLLNFPHVAIFRCFLNHKNTPRIKIHHFHFYLVVKQDNRNFSALILGVQGIKNEK
jgi:hypothetical protein